MEPEKLVAVCYATRVLLGELCGLGFYGVSVLFEFGYGFLCVVDLEDAVYFAHWRLLLQPAGVEYYLNYVLAGVFWTQF